MWIFLEVAIVTNIRDFPPMAKKFIFWVVDVIVLADNPHKRGRKFAHQDQH